VNDQNRARFQELRNKQSTGALNVAEQSELTTLIEKIEADEAAYLLPATQRLRGQREELEAQNHQLEALSLRKEALARRLHDVLTEARAECQAIESELIALRNGHDHPKTE
jgi:hypothetical protein